MPNPVIIDLRLEGDRSFEDLAEIAKEAGGRLLHGPFEGTGLRVAVLPHGMVTGMPSVAIGCILDSGDLVVVKTSARAFVVAARAIAARYPEIDAN